MRKTIDFSVFFTMDFEKVLNIICLAKRGGGFSYILGKASPRAKGESHASGQANQTGGARGSKA